MTDFLTARKPSRTLWLLCGGILLVLYLVFTSDGFFITDNGNKFLQMINFLRHGSVRFVPQNGFFPDGGFHFQQCADGRFVSIYPEYFSVLSEPWYVLFGKYGLLILPMAGTAVTLILFAKLRLPQFYTVLLLLGTPLAFYSATFWEMTCSVPFVLGAFLFLRSRRTWQAGLLLGAGLWFREEMYFAAPAFGLALLLENWRDWKTYAKFGLGFVLAALPVWGYQYAQFGHILGLHGAMYDTYLPTESLSFPGKAGKFLLGYFLYLFQFSPLGESRIWQWIAALCFLFSFLFPKKAAKFCLPAAACILVYPYARLFFSPERMHSTGLCIGLFSTGLLFAGFLPGVRKLWNSPHFSLRLAARSCVVYLIAVPPLLTQSDMGLIWGARHFLVVMPMLLFLSVYGLQEIPHGMRRRLLLLLALAAVFLQFCGLTILQEEKSRNETMLHALQKMPERIVITDVFFLPELLPQLVSEKEFFYFKPGRSMKQLIAELRRSKEKEFLLLLSPQFRQMRDEELRELLQFAPVQGKITPVGSGFSELLPAKLKTRGSFPGESGSPEDAPAERRGKFKSF